MKIIISKILNSESAVFHDEGNEIYLSLQDAFNKGEKVEISFEGLEFCSTQFLNACIGKLYLNFPKELVEESLIIEDVEDEMLRFSIRKVIANALNPREYNQILDDALASF